MRLTVLILLLLVPLTTGYTFSPAQEGGSAQIWNADGITTTWVENNSVQEDNIDFIALDTDGSGVFDRGGKPRLQRITLYPVGEVRGTVNTPSTITATCARPGLTEFTVKDHFVLVLPAGDCVLTAAAGTDSKTKRVTITANDVAEVDFVLASVRNRVLFLVLVLLVAGIIGWLAMQVTKRPRKERPPEAVMHMLSEKEKQVVEYVWDRGPQLAGVVRKDLQIPKTTFHRITKKLIKKKLLTEEEYGNTVRLSWNESFQPK